MRKIVWLEFGALALLIMGPLLGYGYILALDMAWTPHIAVPPITNNTWLFKELLNGLAHIIGSMWVQKLVLLSIFVMSGVGAYRLAGEGIKSSFTAPWYLAGLIYIFNPFVYTRFVEGHYLVLLGYALLPWTAVALWRFASRPGWPTAWPVAVCLAGISIVSLHTIGFAVLLGLVFLVVSWRNWRHAGRWLAGLAAVWLVAMAVWLWPLLQGTSAAGQLIRRVPASEFAAFATRGDVGGVPLTTALLQGFWNDHSGTYTLPSSLGGWWYGVVVALAGLIITGLVRSIRQRDQLGLALAVTGFMAWWLAMGVGWSWSAPTTQWLIDHVPLYRGYREPQKWLMLLVLAYAYLAAQGLTAILYKLGDRAWLRRLAEVSLVLPVLFTPMLLWGAGGQLRSANYPADWYELNRQLGAQSGDFRVLVLPWHLYLPMPFAGRTVANPAAGFFDAREVIAGDNVELAGVTSDPIKPESTIVESQVLNAAIRGTTAGAKLAPLHVRYVVLLKAADWLEYSWLDDQTDLRLVSNTSTMKIYRNEAAK